MRGTVSRGAVFLRHSVLAFAALSMWQASAKEDVKTVYDINPGYVRVKTEYKKAPLDKDKKIRESLFDVFAEKLKGSPYVTGVTRGESKDLPIEDSSYLSYKTIKKEFSAFIQMSLPNTVTLLVKVQESYRQCKNPAKVVSYSDPYEGSSSSQSSDCELNAEVEITGPVAIYGTYENLRSLNIGGSSSPGSVKDMMKDKQKIKITASRSSNKEDLTIDTYAYLESMLFEKALFGFLDRYNVKVVSRAAENLTRHNILLGVARTIRQQNERILEL